MKKLLDNNSTYLYDINLFPIFAGKKMGNAPKRTVNKGLIVLNRGERIAVITLLSLITLLLGFSVFRPAIQFNTKDRQSLHHLDSLMALQEGVSKAPHAEATEGIATSTAPTPVGKPNEASTLSAAHTRQQSSDHTRQQSSGRTETTAVSTSRKLPIQSIDLNRADSTELIVLPQIGEVMASRIHRYRSRLGGYVTMEQLFEVKGMDSARYATIQPYLVLESNDIHRLNVNEDDFKTLLRHPYLEYEQVKALVNHRERKGLIRNWQQMQEIIGEVNPLLERYVTF